MGLGDRIFGEAEELDYEPLGSSASPGRVGKLRSILDPDERVHYVWSFWGDIEITGSVNKKNIPMNTARGHTRAAITNKRIGIKVPEFTTGGNETSIPYHSIKEVHFDRKGWSAMLVRSKVTVHTGTGVYEFPISDPGKEEVRNSVQYIRDNVGAAHGHSRPPEAVSEEASDIDVEPDAVPVAESNNKDDPLTQLERLADLHERGALSDDEYEKMKAKIVEEI